MSEQKISTQVNTLLEKIRTTKGDMDPHKAADYLVELAAWHALLTKLIADTEHEYHVHFTTLLNADDDLSYNKTEVEAKSSEVYHLLRTQQNLEKSMTEEIRALKHWIRVREREWENT